MKKYHIVEAFFLSFYSKSLYQDVAKEWKGLALSYLFLITAICWLPFSYDFHQFLNQFSSQVLPDIIKQVPNITITNGKLSIDKPVPYEIKQPGEGFPLIIFDTSGKYTSLEQTNAIALITQDHVVIKDRTGEKSTVYSVKSITKSGYMNISKSDISYVADKVVFWISVLMYPLAVILTFAYRFLEALFVGGIGLLFAIFFRVPLTYSTSIRLSVVAFTPMLVFTTLADYFSWPIQYVAVISIMLVMAYLLYAVYAQKDFS